MTEFRIRDLANSESESVRRQCGMADSSVEGPEGRQKVAHGASRGAEERLGLIQPRRGGRTCCSSSVAPPGAVSANAALRPTAHAVGYSLQPLRGCLDAAQSSAGEMNKERS